MRFFIRNSFNPPDVYVILLGNVYYYSLASNKWRPALLVTTEMLTNKRSLDFNELTLDDIRDMGIRLPGDEYVD